MAVYNCKCKVSFDEDNYGRALGPEGKLLFFVLATFYLEISTFITRNFDFHNSKFRVKKSKFRDIKSKIRLIISKFRVIKVDISR